MKNFLAGALAVILLAGVAGGFYWLGKNTNQSDKTSPSSLLMTASPNPTAFSPSPTVSAQNDSELIGQALSKKNNWDNLDFKVSVSTNDGKYASGTVSSGGGGGYFYAVKNQGVWEIVADGNGVILCSALYKYPDYPNTLIPECYDEEGKKSVKR